MGANLARRVLDSNQTPRSRQLHWGSDHFVGQLSEPRFDVLVLVANETLGGGVKRALSIGHSLSARQLAHQSRWSLESNETMEGMVREPSKLTNTSGHLVLRVGHARGGRAGRCLLLVNQKKMLLF